MVPRPVLRRPPPRAGLKVITFDFPQAQVHTFARLGVTLRAGRTSDRHAAKRYKRVDRAIAVIWKMLMVAEQRFRRLKAPELIEDVYLGTQYVDGIVFEPTAEKVAA